jgi:hypothetical protein
VGDAQPTRMGEKPMRASGGKKRKSRGMGGKDAARRR